MAAHKLAPGEQETNLLNVARFVLRNPGKTGVLVRKILDRFTGSRKNAPSAENTAWIEAHSEDPADIGRRIAPELWEEAEAFAAETRMRGGLRPTARALSELRGPTVDDRRQETHRTLA